MSAQTQPGVAVVLQKKDLNTSVFTYNSTTKTFSIKPVSTDSANLLTSGADGLASLTPGVVQNNQITYTASLDNATPPNLILYKTVGGTTTAVSTVAVGSTANPQVTGGSYNATSGVLTLTETGSGNNVTINLGAFLTAVQTANSNSISHSGTGTGSSPLTASVILDPESGNLLKVTASGTKVDPADVLALLNANITHGLTVNTSAGLLTSVVNGVTATTNLLLLQGADGSTIGYALAGTS